MAPLPSHTTLRLLIQYSSGGQRHVVELRPQGIATETEVNAYAQEIIDLMLPVMATTDSVFGGYWYPAGSNVSLPITVTTGSGAVTVPAATPLSKSAAISFVGRSVSGRRVRMTFFLLASSGAPERRYPIGIVSADYAALWGRISDVPNRCSAVDGENTIWKPYINYLDNSYFQRKGRG